MAVGQQDISVTVGGDYSPLIQQAGPAASQVQRAFSAINFNSGGLKDYGNGLGVISRRASEFERSLTSANSRVFAFGIAAGQIYLVARAFDQLVKSTIDVQKELADINVILGLSQNQLAKFSSNLFGIANQTAQSFKVVSETSLAFARQGLGTQEVLKRTADALNLVRIGGTDLETSIKAITATLNTFNEVGLDSTAILNKISATDTKFSVSGNVIAEALIRVSSIAEDTNISFDKLIGMITALQQTTARGGSVIGTALGSIFQRVERPQVLEQLQQLGVATQDLSGNALSADRVLSNLAKTYNTLSDAQKNNVTQLVSGMRQANQFKALLADLGSPNSISNRAENTSANASDQALRRQLALNQTLAAQFNTVKNNLTQAASQIGNISIAPALKNLFSATNILANNAVGDKLGEGLLKGLGNYLSGPGLALGGVLIAKFFGQFAAFAGKSLAGIIEQGAARLQLENKVSAAIASQPGMMEKLEQIQLSTLSVEQKRLQTQELITQSILAQSTLANRQSSIVSSVSNMVDTSILGSSSVPFALNRSETSLAGNTKYIRPLASALDVAISREKSAGINISQMRIGNSPVLVSPDNPLGIGLYNTKDEPNGLNQGIQRVIANGSDPRKSGLIPNFAETPVYTKTTSSGNELPLTLNQSVKINDQIENLRLQIQNGIVGFDQLTKNVLKLSDTYKLTDESFSQILGSLRGSLSYYKQKTPLQIPQFSSSTKQEVEDSIKNYNSSQRISQFLKSGNIEDYKYQSPFLDSITGEKRRVLITPSTDFRENSIREQARNFRFTNYEGRTYNSNSGLFANDSISIGKNTQEDINRQLLLQSKLQENKTILLQKSIQLQQQANTEQAELQLNQLNLFDATLGRFNPNGKYNTAVNFATKNNALSSLSNTRQRLAGQGLMGSFIAPLVAGELQTGFGAAFGQESTATRGTSALIGGAGNVASFALGGLAFGPQGALVGAGIGLLTTLPSVIKGFSDTLPDLERNLDKLKESTTKTNDAFQVYLTTSQQISDLNNPSNSERNTTSVGQYNSLLQQNKQALSQIPPEFRGRISSAIGQGDISGAYGLFNIAQTINSQNQNLLSDTAVLRTRNQAGTILSPFKASYISNPLESEFAQGRGVLTQFQKGGDSSAQDILNLLTKKYESQTIGQIEKDETVRNIQLSLRNAGIESSIYGGSNIINLKNKNLTGTDIANSIQSNSEQNLKQPIEELLNLTNQKGYSLAELLKSNPSDISSPEKLQGYLNRNKYSISTAAEGKDFLTEYLKGGTGALSYLQSSTSKEGIDKYFGDDQKLQQRADIVNKVYDDLNDRLAILSNTGAESVKNFEINVANKLSESLTKLKSQSIESDTIAKISQIKSGNNEYSKTYLDYIKQNSSYQNEYQQQIVGINNQFSKDIGDLLLNNVNDFIKESRKTLSSNKVDPEKIQKTINAQISGLNDALTGVLSIDGNGISNISQDLDLNSVSSLKTRITSQINEKSNLFKNFSPNTLATLEGLLGTNNTNTVGQFLPSIVGNNKFSSQQQSDATNILSTINSLPKNDQNQISGLTSDTIKDYQEYLNNIPQVVEQDRQILEKLNEQTTGLSLKLAEAKNNLDSNTQLAYKQLTDNYKLIGEQFRFDQNNSLLSSNLNRQFSASSFDLSRKALISNPVQSIQYNAQAQLLQQKSGFINDLRTSTGSDFGFGINTNLNDIQNQINKTKKQVVPTDFVGPLTDEQQRQRGNLQGLIDLYNKLNNAQQDNAEKVNEMIQSLSNFTDVRAQGVRQRNIEGAGQGTLTSSDFTRAALSPLQYNSQTFQRDAITGIQDFSEVLKSDLSDNLLNVTRGAKTASEALKDVGLSLAENLAKRFTDIGINALFGMGVSGLSSVFPSIGKALSSANGGYIPKFARGGFVNMGSGTKDDVPAFLSGGEFVLNKKAVSKIGIQNLNSINGLHSPSLSSDLSGAITKDSISLSPNSVNIGLANSFELNNKLTKGTFNVSSLLSGIGASDQNNPQNRLKFARQKYAFSRNQYNKQYSGELGAYNLSQYLSLGSAYLGALGSFAQAFKPSTNATPGALTTDINGNPISNINSLQNIQSYGLYPGNSAFSQTMGGGFGSNFSNVVGGGNFQYTTPFYMQSNGGYIPKFASGGYFGGDSSSDKFKAMVMGGEYIVSPKTVSKYGINYFKGLNDAGKYSDGGTVSSLYNGGDNDSTSKIIMALGEIRDKINVNKISTNLSNQNQTPVNQTNHVTVTVSMASDGTVNNQNSITKSNNDNNHNSQQNKESLNKFSDLIKGSVINHLTQQSRPGGILYNTFAPKKT